MPLDQRGFEIPAETKPEVFSLEGLRDWLRTKPILDVYRYSSGENCLITQFASAVFGKYTLSLHPDTSFSVENSISMTQEMRWVAADWPHTFGAALERCNRAIAARPKGA